MRTILLYNPISGRGAARVAAGTAVERLEAAGHPTRLEPTRAEPAEQWLPGLVCDAELLVILGGDGAVRMCASTALGTGTPIYHMPYGTENLFAREFGADRSVAGLLSAMDAARYADVDVGVANGEPFMLMVSIGYDAEVVADLSTRRRGSITHLSYAGPILRQLVRWSAPALRIELDGATLVDDQPGFVVIANSRQYGARFDPAIRADMQDGELDVVFCPTRSRLRLLAWAAAIRLRRHLGGRGLVYERGRRVSVQAHDPFNYQVDGDRPAATDGTHRTKHLDAGLRDERLKVLLPAR